MEFICENIGSKGNDLTFAGMEVGKLASDYGTPLYVMDESRIRQNCRIYRKAFAENMPEGSMVLYAGKACCFKQMYRILNDENMGIDVVSAGEIYTASEAGFPMEKAFFHGNNKTEEEVALAIEKEIGYFVIDNLEEAEIIEREAERQGIVQNALIRITPGIDTHTYEAVNTGKVDSKFGNAIATGAAEKIVKTVLDMPHISLRGYHCHVGSQVFAEDVFERAGVVMLDFSVDMKDRLGFEAEIINLGGGYGVRYVNTDPQIDIAEKITQVALAIKKRLAELNQNGQKVKFPKICMEPGRSIVADAGMTLYRAGAIKEIPGYKNYVSVDGGMTDNPRYALYRSAYTCLNASRIDEYEENSPMMEVTIAGKCCESGDIIQEHVKLPVTTKRGDIIAVCTTGAYNFSMSSNYNRVPKPAVVMVKDGKPYVAVRRETLEHVANLDI